MKRFFREIDETKREKDIPLKKVSREMLAKEGKQNINVADLDRPICKDIADLPEEIGNDPAVDRLPEEIFTDLFKDDYGDYEPSELNDITINILRGTLQRQREAYAKRLGYKSSEELSIQERFAHDVKFNLTYNVDENSFIVNYIDDIDTDNWSNFRMADLEGWVKDEIDSKKDRLSWRWIGFSVSSFILTKDRFGYFASPIVIIESLDWDSDHDAGGWCGRLGDVFYMSRDIWNAVSMAPNYEEIFNRIFSSHVYDNYDEEILGIVDYSYLEDDTMFISYKQLYD